MPRLKSTREQNQFRANVTYYMTLTGTNIEKIAKVLGITPKSVYNKIANPERIPIGEISRLARFFGCSLNDLIDGVKFI